MSKCSLSTYGVFYPKKVERKFTREKDAKIKLIIYTFLSLVERLEYSKVTTNRIAKEANLSIGTIYCYFKNKQEIRDLAFKQNVEELDMDEEGFVKILRERNLEQTQNFVREYLKAHQEGYSYQKAYDRVRAASLDIFQEYEENMTNIVGVFIGRAVEMNYLLKELRDIAVKAIILAIKSVETYTHQYLFQLPDMFSSDEEFVMFVARLFLFTLIFFLPKK